MKRQIRRRTEAHPSVQRATRLFLEQRQTDPDILLWAARLTPDHSAERSAVRDLILYSSNQIAEPYRSAWRYIAQSWANEITDADLSTFHVQDAVEQGVDPRMLLDDIVSLVEPRIQVDSVYGRRPTTGKIEKVSDLLPVTLGAAKHVRIADLGLTENVDPKVWGELVDRLESALVCALHHADRLGSQWLANWVARVYRTEEPDEDPDQFRDGFAPIAKLYSEALEKLIRVDPQAAARRLEQLDNRPWKLTRRIWAVGARAPDAVGPLKIGVWLDGLADDDVWDVFDYPEFAELRAARFGELDKEQRQRFEVRVRKGPPLSSYRRSVSPERKRALQREAATHEMRRLASSGAELTASSRVWLAAREDVQGSSDVWSRYSQDPPWTGPDVAPLDLEDPELPAKLDAALTDQPYVTSREAIDAVGANWNTLFARLRDDSKLLRHGRLVGALAFTLRDQTIGRTPESEDAKVAAEKSEALLALLPAIPESALRDAADGLGHWFDIVPEAMLAQPQLREAWLRLWPHAVAETNAQAAQRVSEITAEATTEATPADPEERISTSALNSAVGRMLSAFGRMLPRGEDAATAFLDPHLRAMREAAATAVGEAGRQGLYRLLLLVRYLNHVDPEWTRAHLLGPLRDGADPTMWDAISRIPLLAPEAFAEVAAEQVRKVWDDRLSAKLRSRLAERVILPVVFALEEGSPSPVPFPDVEQMLRLGGPAVRAHCASALVRVLESRKEPDAYRQCIKPILTTAWPKDRSTLSPALADALAAMPAAAHGAFAECVDDIAGLLMPFDAWSLWEYRIYERDGDERSLRPLASDEEAFALLKLLDLTIGQEEQAVRPRDLDVALAAIAERSKRAARTTAFARLTALTR